MTAKDLKNAILQEAVQGKLVPQIVSEGNAKDLLEQIKAEKAKLVKEGKIKKEKPLPVITEDEIPFDIPENWCWCRLGELIAFTDAGKSPLCQNRPRVDDEWGVIKTTAVQDKFFIEEENKVLSTNFKLDKSMQIHKNDLLITRAGPRQRTGILCLVEKEPKNLILSDKTVRLNYYSEIVNPYFLMNTLSAPAMQNDIEQYMTGMAASQVNISQENMKKFLIPLPPLSEQKRIVEAIEKFMPLVEEYGKKESVLKDLNANIGTLTKKAILQEAVQGKLVPQIASEGNAKDLLEQIKAEKAKLVKEGKIKKEKPLPGITEDEIPFDIPENWCWCKVGDLFSTMSGLGYKKDVLEEKTNHMIRVLRGGNILDTSYVFKDDDIMISSEYVKPELFLKKNYLITPAVTSLEHIGKMGYVEKDYDDTVVGGFVLMLIPYLSDETISKYCLYLFGTHWFRTMCKEITHKSGQAFYNLSRDKLLQLEIPLPPLSEQKRIVEAIEKLLPYCEKLGRE